MIGSSFEEVLREADAAEMLAQGGSPAQVGARKSGAVHTAEMTLLRRPAVFTLAIVWDSPQVRVCVHVSEHVRVCSEPGPLPICVLKQGRSWCAR
jgi:hypothetical protein